jgi:hypothetical protein
MDNWIARFETMVKTDLVQQYQVSLREDRGGVCGCRKSDHFPWFISYVTFNRDLFRQWHDYRSAEWAKNCEST